MIQRNVEHDAWDLAGLKKLPITGKRTTCLVTECHRPIYIILSLV